MEKATPLILNGRHAAKMIREKLAAEIAELANQDIHPQLAVVRVGDDPASDSYVRAKHRAAKRIGMRSCDHIFPADTTEQTLIEKIDELNQDDEIDGFLVQLPLPDHIDPVTVIQRIHPSKDVDGFHPLNLGRLFAGFSTDLIPCTARGILALLDHYEIPLKGVDATVVGRSNIVGKPTGFLLTGRHATVTLCHSRTKDLEAMVRRADLLVVATGAPELIPGSWVKEGAVVVDAGITRVGERWVGDVDHEGASARASAISPVPGGVGPMTVTMLLEQTITAAKRRRGL